MTRQQKLFIAAVVLLLVTTVALGVIAISSAINSQRHSDAEDAFLRDIYNHSRTDSQLIADGEAVCEELDSGVSYKDVIFKGVKNGMPDGGPALVDLTSSAVHNLCPEHIAAEDAYVGR